MVRSPWIVVANLVLVEAIFIVAEATGHKKQQASKMTFLGTLGIGLAQTAALECFLTPQKNPLRGKNV